MTTGQRTKKRTSLDGDDLRQAFQAANRCLERHRDIINALNVFPVPDGDTGTNMLLTTRSVIEECHQAAGSSAGDVMAAMAHGALLGARGNSGVILSQFFHGLAQGLRGKDRCNGDDLAQALQLASKAAYSAVSKPVDGTMLTVIRELAAAASQRTEKDGGSKSQKVEVLSVWQAALEEAKQALSRTPMQLPVLLEAGVVDAGGQGVVALLEGVCCYLAGENVEELELQVSAPVLSEGFEGVPAVQAEYLDATEHDIYGYCTQFLILGSGLDLDTIRGDLAAMAESTVVVGDDTTVKVHLHAEDPGPVISYAVSLGTVDQVSLTNMDQQHQEFVALHRESPSRGAGDSPAEPHVPQAATAVVAVAWGEGSVRLFQGLGCPTIPGGQTMNPSTREMLDAAIATGAGDVIILPNNSNIVPAARQAAVVVEGAGQEVRLHVVPSRTLPQGVAAILAFNPEGDLQGNLESMEQALATVKTIEVTRAVRQATLDGMAVSKGQYIGLLEGELVAAGESAYSALQQAFSKVAMAGESQEQPVSHEMLTLYWGSDIEEDQATAAAAQLQDLIPGVAVEVVYGGQPHYHYIASLE